MHNTDTDRIAALISRYIQQTITVEEAAELNNWLDQSDQNRQLLYSLINTDLLTSDLKDLYRAGVEQDLRWQALVQKLPVNQESKMYFMLHNQKGNKGVKHAYKNADNNVDRLPLLRWRWGVAASVLILILTGALWYFSGTRASSMQVIYNGYGSTKHLILPDGSDVWLNANSRLTYAAQWKAAQAREVWLSGEAFFDVKHIHRRGAIKENELFIVHTGNEATIQVLGTSFNVKDRAGITQVVLEKGKVRLHRQSEALFEPADMSPGDMITYDYVHRKQTKENVNVMQYASWRNGVLEFDRTPFSSVVKLLEDNYGYQVEVNDDTILRKELSGTFDASNGKLLLEVIASVLNIRIQQNDKKLSISRK
ncbi:MAG TPA: FecR domain-containing protein [Chitinophaga sp.]|uniref:FecR family protein n=1 Tax=Chitinophaga sp. TaxID=1869181 RepID=UPI002CA54F65|nr:FecR domain-containing protein [Chitinophaga sp.]HVI48455.1 FecR domain-containing protein [Chitinophaga sp.]